MNRGGRRARCRKVRFRDHEQAVDALHRAKNARWFAESDGSTTRRRECRTYPCPACQGFHLTSRPAWTD